MTDARIGWGAEFHLSTDDDALNLTECAEITAISLPNSQVEDVNATHFKSPNRRMEYIAGLIDDGEGTFEMNYVPDSATDQLIKAALTAGDARAYKVVVPDGAANWEVSGTCIVKGYERNVPIDDRMTATLTVRFSGSATEAAGV